VIARSIHQTGFHVRKPAAEINERGAKISGRKRGVNTGCDPPALAAGASLEASDDCLRILDYAPGSIKEFLTSQRWSSAPARAVEQCCI
jgi:hypothetical protein